jgi:hypothetical protein
MAAMTQDQRNAARATLVQARDAAHMAVCALDQIDSLESAGITAATDAFCAQAQGYVGDVLTAAATLATMAEQVST